MNVNNYILGNGMLHQRFRSMVDIVGQLVAHAPRPVNIGQLEQHTGHCAAELQKLCSSLGRAASRTANRTRMTACSSSSICC